MLITLEGTEGSGKSTQLSRLAARLRQQGRRVRELREPGGTPLGEEIRHLLKHAAAGTGMTAEAELLLMNAARAELVRQIIRPALAAGEVVLCDRFYHSTLAYQGWGRQLDLTWVRKIVEFAVGPTRPDLTLVLAVPHTVSLERQRQRQRGGTTANGPTNDRFEAAGDDFFARVLEGFQALVTQEPERLKIVDATASIDQVEDEIWSLVQSRLEPV